MYWVEYEEGGQWKSAEKGINLSAITYHSLLDAKRIYEALLPFHVRIGKIEFTDGKPGMASIILDSGAEGNAQIEDYWRERHTVMLTDLVVAIVQYDSNKDMEGFYQEICSIVSRNRSPM